MSDAVSEASRQSIEAGSKSFAAAARLFDPGMRDSARLFYAWCRHCDDVIDALPISKILNLSVYYSAVQVWCDTLTSSLKFSL